MAYLARSFLFYNIFDYMVAFFLLKLNWLLAKSSYQETAKEVCSFNNVLCILKYTRFISINPQMIMSLMWYK